MATVVTIGRNVKGIPMDTRTWEHFRDELEATVRQNVGEVYFQGSGFGDSQDWGREDAHTVIGADPTGGWEQEERLLEQLHKVGDYYGQEAVAVTIGPTRFV